MASMGFWVGGFRRRGDFSRGRSWRDRFFAPEDFWDFLDFRAGFFLRGVFCEACGFAFLVFAFLKTPILRAISVLL
jgi:hypothetical protein